MKLLKNLYKVYSPSGKTKPMADFICNYANNIGLTPVVDNGNVYITKGKANTYPCVIAHIDQVQTDPKELKVFEYNDILFGWSDFFATQWGLGADDKNGIWVALKCLQRYDNIKVAFFRDEEIGCVGSSLADMQFFDNCRFVLQADRKGANDFITKAGCTPLCSKEFVEACNIKAFGYNETSGLMTDVMELKETGLAVSACNISCGYYNPHSNNEITSIKALRNCLKLVYNIIDNVQQPMPHYHERPVTNYNGYDWSKWNINQPNPYDAIGSLYDYMFEEFLIDELRYIDKENAVQYIDETLRTLGCRIAYTQTDLEELVNIIYNDFEIEQTNNYYDDYYDYR